MDNTKVSRAVPLVRHGPRWATAYAGHSLYRNTQLARFVDQVAGDAGAGEGDETLGQQVQEIVVAPKRRGPSVGGPVRLADDLMDAVALGPARGDLLDPGAAAMD